MDSWVDIVLGKGQVVRPGVQVPTVTFRVDGAPATKGSTRSFVSKSTGKVVTIPDSRPALRKWHAAVRRAAMAAGLQPISGAVRVTVAFDLPAPQCLLGKGWTAGTPGATITVEALPEDRTQVITRPDIDKTIRSSLDALSGIAFADDGQVTEVVASKRYALAATQKAGAR